MRGEVNGQIIKVLMYFHGIGRVQSRWLLGLSGMFI